MKKTVIWVFSVLAVILLCLLLWAQFFGPGIQAVWNTPAGFINDSVSKIAGQQVKLLPEWNATGGKTVNDGLNGF